MPPQITRILILTLVFLAAYVLIGVRLWHEQIHMGEEYKEQISKQSIRRIRYPGIRGRIYSSDKHILADNHPAFDVVFHLEEMRRPGRQSNTVKHIMECIGRTAKLLKRKNQISKKDILEQMRTKPGLPLQVFSDLSKTQAAAIAELSPPVQGLELTVSPIRYYPGDELAAHILGYVGKEDRKKAKDKEEFSSSYYQPDFVGRQGLEKLLDDELRGKPGKSIVRVDNRGFIHEVIGRKIPAECGDDVVLTIDYKAQRTAEKVLRGKYGALVLLDADTGAVLAMASTPAFDPGMFVPSISSKDWRKLNSDPQHPLLNKAVGAYTPGSILKPLIAMSILENGVNPYDTVFCDGATYIGNARVRCWSWRSGGHGRVDLVNAIKHSCNDYFIENGRKLGLDKIQKTLKAAGIGQHTGFPLRESNGVLPTRKYKKKVDKVPWNEHDTAILSIGQGKILLTPLQAAIYTAAIANGGTLWKPFLVREIRSPDGHIVAVPKPQATGKLPVSAKNLKLIQEGMYKVINASDGTAKRARNPYITLSGKTGTAEMGPCNNRYTNTWFIAFGKHNNRNLAIAVFIIKGQSGGRTSAPIVSQFFTEWLKPPTNR